MGGGLESEEQKGGQAIEDEGYSSFMRLGSRKSTAFIITLPHLLVKISL